MPDQNPPIPPIDEYTLAAFMAGTLPESRRAEVVSYLAANADARELLRMAYQALEATRETPVSEAALRQVASRPALAPSRQRINRSGRLARWTAAAALIVSVGIGLRLALGPPTDSVRAEQTAGVLPVEVTTTAGVPAITWQPVPEAYQYHIVVWNPQQAGVVARFETEAARLDASDPRMTDLRTRLVPGHPYSVRVDAIDAANRLIRSSDAVVFSL